METLRDVVVYIHIIGFAVTFGAWATQLATKKMRTLPIMDIGVAISLVSGLALAAPWPAGIELNYMKIGIKVVLLLILGALTGIANARQRRTGEAAPAGMFWGVGITALLAAGIAVIW
ncbi:Fe-S protein [Parenemella sanctibonifatiensis]|uniref:Fe-S protein n=1 Tax=Parenemella sanctibonifatiensis TaxID=2016505 RepID=A0A255E8J8_9ACTN|nr:Fe-S protein [Parenemella sanctibonifatiensis]OYN87836.1 Fe-S protein [Parenemella sanctibonifatiensis]